MNGEQKRLRIAFLTSLDPKDRRSWSGTIYHIAQALQKHCGDVSYIGPLNPAREKYIGKILNRISQVFLGKNIHFAHGTRVSKGCAKIAARRLKQEAFDVIVAPTGETELASLETDIPTVLVTDSTYAIMRDYYPAFTNLLDSSFRDINTVEASAIKKADLILYASAWAARSAIEDYHAQREKVHVVPFGANFEESPPDEVLLERKKSDRCRLLFIALGAWERKGGEIAFETLLKLEEMGISAELTVLGSIPPKRFSHQRMKVIPLLDKNDPLQRKELEQLYLSSDFLLFPSRNECYGIAMCEANAFGLPAIGANTGGIPEIITEGKNGFLLPYSARGEAYAEIIAELYQDGQRYTTLVQSCRATFDERLNWDVWGTTANRLITELLEQKKAIEYQTSRQESPVEPDRLMEIS